MATDRNQQAKQEFAIAQARAQFARAIAAGQTGLYDDLGALLKAGQYIIFDTPPNTWRWLVEDVVQDLRPNAQPGSMRLTVMVRVPLYLMAGTRIPSVLVVGEQQMAAHDADVQAAEEEAIDNGSSGVGGAPAAAAGEAGVPAGEAGGEGAASKSGIVIAD